MRPGTRHCESTNALSANTVSRATACLMVAVTVCLGSRGQEADDEAPLVEIPEGFDPSPFRREESTSPQDQMIELFHEVERRMSRSTELLFDASKGDVSKLDDLEASGLEDLGQDQDSSARAAVAGLLRASKGEG